MGGRRLTDEDKKNTREMYVNGANMDVIAETFKCAYNTVLVYTRTCGDREFSVFRDGRAHNGKRGRKRKEKMQIALDF